MTMKLLGRGSLGVIRSLGVGGALRLVGVVVVALSIVGCRFDPTATMTKDAEFGDARPDHDGGWDAGDGRVDGGEVSSPIGVKVVGQARLNPEDVVNEATQHAVAIQVTLPDDSLATDRVFLQVTDGTNSVHATPIPAPDRGGAVMFDQDCSPLDDGPVTLRTWVARGGATSSVTEGQAVKDTHLILSVDPVVTPVAEDHEVVSGLVGPDVIELSVRNETTGATSLATFGVRGLFFSDVQLTPGDNQISVTGTDGAWNTGTVHVDLKNAPLVIRQDAGYGMVFVESTGAFPSISASDTKCSGVVAAGLADGDDVVDLFVSGCEHLYVNNGQGVFPTKVVTAVIVGDRGAVWADFDNDGDFDLAVAGFNPAPSNPVLHLYRNTFKETGSLDLVDATEVSLTPDNPEGLAWMDQDGDGQVDLLLEDGDGVRLLHNEGSGNFFVDQSASLGLTSVDIDNGDWVAVADFDRDGDVDAVVGAATGRLFINQGSSFIEEHLSLGLSFSHGDGRKWGLCWGDYDNDGDFDLWLRDSEMIFGPYNAVFSWDATRFDSVGVAFGVDHPAAIDDAAWGDVNNDGLLDLVWMIGSPGAYQVVVALNQADSDGDGQWTFDVQTLPDTIPWSQVIETLLLEDVDQDGDLDLVVGRVGASPAVLLNGRNDDSQAHVDPRYLRVRLSGSAPNPGGGNKGAIGAVVELHDPDSQGNCQIPGALLATRQVDGGRGNGGQESPILFFGGLHLSATYCVVAYFPGQAQPVTARVRPRAYLDGVFHLDQ
ncbi:MAG: VCBS repeat-containing protein [Deltaproteobacteria bacterium]|nr:VCBS repeat-containing protein [Deltaproteobacteria bacterium]